jgi:competence ComEA-like helix-hairpin-helix protein
MTGAMLLAILLVAQPGLPRSATSIEQERKGKTAPVTVIDVNQATEQDFAGFPGIGPKLARRIVAYREKHGPFRRVEDLLVIRGIGHKKWRRIRPYLRVGSDESKK